LSSRSSILGIDAGGVMIAVALASAVYFGGVLPSRRAAEAAVQERADLAAKHEELDNVESNLRTARQNLAAESKESGTDVLSRTPLDRIRRISELAQASGVNLTEVTPKAEQPGQRFNQVPLTLRGLGRSPGFIRLLQSIQQEFPDTQLVSLVLKGAPAVPEADQSFEAGLVWYTVAHPDANGRGGNGPNAGKGGGTPKTAPKG
jgi:hypothetical protein